MTPIEELNQLLKLIRKYNLPLSPILEYAINEKIEQNQGQTNKKIVKGYEPITEEKSILEVKPIAKTNKSKKKEKVQRPKILRQTFVPNTNEEKNIKLTREMIEAARTPNGGFTKSQLASIGIGWPPPNNWISEKEGEMISKSQYEEFNRIEYAKRTTYFISNLETTSYLDVANNDQEKQRMESVLCALSNFDLPATPRDVMRTINQAEWGDTIHEDTIDTILKKLPEVEYIKWGKYILKSKNYDKN